MHCAELGRLVTVYDAVWRCEKVRRDVWKKRERVSECVRVCVFKFVVYEDV